MTDLRMIDRICLVGYTVNKLIFHWETDRMVELAEMWNEERKTVLRLQHRLENKCSGCVLAISHGAVRIDPDWYAEFRADIAAFFSLVDAEISTYKKVTK